MVTVPTSGHLINQPMPLEVLAELHQAPSSPGCQPWLVPRQAWALLASHVSKGGEIHSRNLPLGLHKQGPHSLPDRAPLKRERCQRQVHSGSLGGNDCCSSPGRAL